MTELEVKAGLLETDASGKPDKNVLIFCRTIDDLYEKLDRGRARKFADLKPDLNEIIESKHEAITSLKNVAMSKLPEHNIFRETIK